MKGLGPMNMLLSFAFSVIGALSTGSILLGQSLYINISLVLEESMAYILGMDVGGTNTSIGIFDKKLRQVMFFSCKTKEKHPYESAREVMRFAKEKRMKIVAAGVAVAGPVHNGKVHLPNADISLSEKMFASSLGMGKTTMLNDFEAIAYGLNAIGPKSMIPLTKNKVQDKGVKVVLGAGTGLGKAVLYFSEKKGFHVPLGAEEGHTAIAVASKNEFGLLESIKKRKKTDVVWEDVLSGRGISAIYRYLQKKDGIRNPISEEISRAKDKASVISKHRKKDRTCKKAFAAFSAIYARFIRNSMLQSLPYGGLYVAGGIAMRNPDILASREFKAELYKSAQYAGIIRKMPLFLITDYGVGVKGAAFLALRGR
jgi:glucokinase